LVEARHCNREHKGKVFLLFDNIDKAWKANGLDNSDVVMICTLLDASKKLGNDFRRAGTNYYSAVFPDIEPVSVQTNRVSADATRRLKFGDQRLAPGIRHANGKLANFASQRLRRLALTLGNVAHISASRTQATETRLVG
jgi:hypothetical protein